MKQHGVFILTGEQGSGKTTRLQEIIDILREKKIPLFGFYALGYWEKDVRSKFDLVDIRSGEKYLLCERTRSETKQKGAFVFYPETIKKGEALLYAGMQNPNALAIIDEIGPFELKGETWDTVLQELLKKRQPVLMTVRQHLVDKVIERYRLTSVRIYPVNKPAQVISKEIQHFLSEQTL